MVISKIDEYIEEICSYVKFKKAHKEIRAEFLDHFEEKTEDFILEGMSEEEASEKALAEMGEADIIGKQLDDSHKPSPEWSILIITALFSILGVVTVYLVLRNQEMYYSGIYVRNILFNVVGFVSMLALYFFDYKKLEKHSMKIFLGITLILFLQLLMAVPINGRKAWIALGPLSVNITELSLFLYVISLSKLIRSIDLRKVKGYIYLSLMLLLPLSIYIQLKVSMEALIYFVIFIVLMVKSKVKLSYIFSIIGVFLTGSIYVFFSSYYRIKRLLGFLNPENDPLGTGYIIIQIRKLLASAGLHGNGFNLPGRTIPEVYSDFILTYIIYAFGWITGIVIMTLVLAFILRMFTAARTVQDTYGKLIILGFMLIFAIEFIWNILMALGLLPIVSVSLPFISYGGSRALTQMLAIGIIMSIYRCRSLSYA